MPDAIMKRPPWRIIGDSSELVLSTWGEPPGPESVRLDARNAEAQLRQLTGPAWRSGFAHRALLDAAAFVTAHHAMRLGVALGDARSVVIAALARGILVGWRIERVSLGGGGGTAADNDDAPVEPMLRQRTWIELELTDMDGNPVPGEAYWIKLPDGTVREGALDEHGRAYFGDLDPGSAEIRWPNRDGDATENALPLGQSTPQTSSTSPTSGRSAVERTWVEIELLDMVDQPVPHERYWIKLPNGTVREGALDAMGLAYFDDLDPGQCTIRWLGRDEEAAVLEPDATTPGANDRVAAQVRALTDAARDGVPFCEECERARLQSEAAA